MELFDTARRVKRGARFLDKKIPNWRSVLRKHSDEFDFADGEFCVLGTLEHYSGRMRELAKKRNADDLNGRFIRAIHILGLEDKDEALGFDVPLNTYEEYDEDGTNEAVTAFAQFSELWRAEFEK